MKFFLTFLVAILMVVSGCGDDSDDTTTKFSAINVNNNTDKKIDLEFLGREDLDLEIINDGNNTEIVRTSIEINGSKQIEVAHSDDILTNKVRLCEERTTI